MQKSRPAPRRARGLFRFLPSFDTSALKAPVYVGAGFAVLVGLYALGPLHWVTDMVAEGIDAQAQKAGFRIETVEVAGAQGQARADIERALALTPGQTILRLDLEDAHARVAALDWVKSASVMRLLPNTVYVSVEARQAYALWQSHNIVRVIDIEGRVIRAAQPSDFKRLPLVVGEGAQGGASSMVDMLTRHPRIAQKVDAMVFVGGRRWNLRLKSGADVLLPEVGAESALEELERVDAVKALLDMPLERIDMRLDGQMAVRPKTDPATTPPVPATESSTNT